MTKPLITIGITCYNEGDWLLECWDSVLAQTDERWTAVLVMDGTTHERTREVFEQLEHPKLLKYAMPYNQGAYPTGNKAFELGQAPYHFWLAADDHLVPESVALVLKAFAEHPDAGFVYGDYEVFVAQDRISRHLREYAADDLVKVGGCLPGACAYRRDVWVELGGFAPELPRGNGDHDFHIGLFERGYRGVHCGEVFYRYRVGHASVCGSYTDRVHESHETIVRRHPEFFEDEARRRRFLGMGYACAAEASYLGGIRKASGLVDQAAEHGCGKLVRRLRWWLRFSKAFVCAHQLVLRMLGRFRSKR